MKIAIDLRIFGSEPGGLGRYNEQLLRHIMLLDKSNEYFLIFKSEPKNLNLPSNFHQVIFNCHWYSLREQLLMPSFLKKLNVDLVHFPHFNVPIFYNGPYVLTIHDLIMTKFPSRRASRLSWPMFYLKYWLYNQVIRIAIFKARAIIAVSQYGKNDLVNYFKLNSTQANKISVIYEGLTKFNVQPESANELPENYFLYVGNAYPHKNLEFLIKAFCQFNKDNNFKLLLVGKKNYFYKNLENNIEQLAGPNKNNIVFCGYVPDQKLPSYYQNAQAYIFPSLYEGFGLPPLEAMSYQTPVLSSNTSCLPEILGSAALYFDPTNVESLVAAIAQIIDNQSLRAKLIKAGQEQIKKYNWSATAQATIAIYNRSR